MLSEDLVFAQLASKSVNTADHQTKDDCASDRIWEDQAATKVICRVEVAEANGQDGDIAKIQGVWVAPALNSCKYRTPSAEPDEKHHGLKDQVTLLVGEGEMLRVMAQEIAKHIGHQYNGVEEIETGSNYCMPESLRVYLSRPWRDVYVHARLYAYQDATGEPKQDDGCW